MITPRPQTHCVQSLRKNMASLSKTIVNVKRYNRNCEGLT